MSGTNPTVNIRLNLDGEQAVTSGVNRVGKAFVTSADDALKLEKASAAVAVAQAKLEQVTAAAAKAQKDYSEAVRLGIVSQEKIADLRQKAATASAAEAQQAARYKEQSAALGALQNAHAGVTGATKLSAYHTAQLSAQLQDLFVQIQAGGSPVTALIQQGSQLSAVFGGTGNALAAVRSLISPTVVGVGALAAAAGALSLAWLSGHNESAAFRRDLALTGNAAGVTADTMASMAKSIGDSTKAGIGTAREALSALVASGRVSNDALGATAAAAASLARATGGSASDIASKFAGMADNVAESARALNQQYNFLTAAQYAQIKALEDQGRGNEALAQTMTLLNGRVSTTVQQLGTLERGWNAVKNAASGAWDSAKGIGRDPTVGQQIEALQLKLEQGGVGRRGTMSTEDGRAAKVAAVKEQIELLREQQRMLNRTAEARASEAAQNKAGIDFEKIKTENMSAQAKLAEQIANLSGKAAAAGSNVKPEDLTEVIKKTILGSEAYADSVAMAMAKISAASSVASASAAAEMQKIANIYALGGMNQIDYIERTGAAEVKALQRDRSFLVQEQAIASERARLGSESAKADVERLGGAIGAKDIEIATRRAKTIADGEALILQRRIASFTATRNMLAQEAQEYAAYIEQQDQARRATIQASDANIQSINESIQLSQTERRLSLASAEDRASEIALLRIKLDLQRRIKGIEENSALTPEDRSRLIANETAAASRQGAEASAKIYFDAWNKTANDIGDALYDAIKGNYASIKQLIEREVIKPVIVAQLRGVSGSIADAIGGSGGGASSGGTAGDIIGAILGAKGSSSGVLGSSQWGIEAFGKEFMLKDIGTGVAYLDAFMAAKAGKWGTSIGEGIGAYVGGPIGATIGKMIGSAADKLFAGGAGTPHMGGYVSVSTAGAISDITKAQGGIQQAETQQAVGLLASQLNSTLVAGSKAFGVEASSSIRAVFEADGHDAAWGIFQVLSAAGAQTAGFGAKGTFAADPTKGFEQFTGEAAVAVRDALLKIDLPKWASDTLSKITASDGPDKLAQAVDSIVTAQAAIIAFGKQFSGMGGTFGAISRLSSDATASLAEMAGGLDKLSGNLSNYFETFYTDAERTSMTMGAIGAALGDVGISLPKTREQFRALVEAQDLTTDAGRKAYAALLSVQGAFAGVTQAAEKIDLASAIDGVIGKFQTTAQSQTYKYARTAQNLQAAGVLTNVPDLAGVLSSSTKEAVYQFAEAFVHLGNVSDEAKLAVINAAGALADLKDEAGAAALAASQRAAASITDLRGTGFDLQAQLLDAQGQNAEAAALRRKTELDKLTAGLSADDSKLLTAQYDATEALRSQLNAQLAANEAARSAADAARQQREAMASLAQSLYSEVTRIRGLTGADKSASFAAAQADFLITSSQARSGNQSAAQRLAGLSQNLLTLAEANASNAFDLARIQGRVAGSLEGTAGIVDGTRPGVAPLNPALFSGTQGADVTKELQAMREESRAQQATIASLQIKILKMFEEWDRTGLATKAVV